MHEEPNVYSPFAPKVRHVYNPLLRPFKSILRKPSSAAVEENERERDGKENRAEGKQQVWIRTYGREFGPAGWSAEKWALAREVDRRVELTLLRDRNNWSGLRL